MEVVDEKYWDNLKTKISKKLKFCCENYNDLFLSRRVEVRLRKYNLYSYKEYARLLDSNSKELKNLLKELSINVTHFFRDINLYKVLMKRIIPELVMDKKKKKEKRIKIWSAGCSTGEEPYSIGICILEQLGSKIKNFNIEIAASDYDKKNIRYAKKGIYDELEFQEMPEIYKERYFVKKNNKKYKIKNKVKKIIEFTNLDIIHEDGPKNVDIIFCRNTMIFFEEKTKSKVYTRFINNLNPKGFLIIGKNECLSKSVERKISTFKTKGNIYRK